MPPRLYSRHTFCTGFYDVDGPAADAGVLQLNDPEPFLYRDLPDNIHHIVEEGQNLWNLAARYYRGMPSPSQFFWVIANFQPDPIIDVTLKLELGQPLVIPSLLTLRTLILSEARRAESGL